MQDDETTNNLALFEPRGAQIEALCALENTRAEGAGRALVQAATGVGKTYLAAFDSKDYERVLFVAHREEILSRQHNLLKMSEIQMIMVFLTEKVNVRINL